MTLALANAAVFFFVYGQVLGEGIQSCLYESSICGCESDQGPISLTSFSDGGISTPSDAVEITWNPCKDQRVGDLNDACVLQVSGHYYDCGAHSSTYLLVHDGNLYFLLNSDENNNAIYTEIQCVCGSKETLEFSTSTYTTYYDNALLFGLILNSRSCCPYGYLPYELSTWDIVLIVFFASVLMYLVMGILYQLFVRKDGEEQDRYTRIICAAPEAIVACFSNLKSRTQYETHENTRETTETPQVGTLSTISNNPPSTVQAHHGSHGNPQPIAAQAQVHHGSHGNPQPIAAQIQAHHGSHGNPQPIAAQTQLHHESHGNSQPIAAQIQAYHGSHGNPQPIAAQVQAHHGIHGNPQPIAAQAQTHHGSHGNPQPIAAQVQSHHVSHGNPQPIAAQIQAHHGSHGNPQPIAAQIQAHHGSHGNQQPIAAQIQAHHGSHGNPQPIAAQTQAHHGSHGNPQPIAAQTQVHHESHGNQQPISGQPAQTREQLERHEDPQPISGILEMDMDTVDLGRISPPTTSCSVYQHLQMPIQHGTHGNSANTFGVTQNASVTDFDGNASLI